MGHCSQRSKRRRYRIVGGGFRWNREPNGVKGGSMKAKKRIQRKLDKAHKKRQKAA